MTAWTVAHQGPLSMELSGKNTPDKNPLEKDLPDSGIEPEFLAL